MIRFLLFATAFAAVLAAVLVPRRGMLPGILWSVGLGVAASLAVVIAWSGGTRRDRKLIAQAPGITQLGDGDVVAVCGTIEARGPTLRSPVHGEPCVAYQYLLYHSVPGANKGRKRVVDYAGYGIVPAAVKGQYVTVPLGGFPTLDDFGKFAIEESPSLERVGEYLRSAKFDPIPEDEMIEWVEVMDKKWDGGGTRVANYRRAEGHDPANDLYWEQRVRPGSDVCVIGVWSERSGSIVRTDSQELQLYQGTAADVSAAMGSSLVAARVIAVLLAASVIAIVAYLLRAGASAGS